MSSTPLEDLTEDSTTVYCPICQHTRATRIDKRHNIQETIVLSIAGTLACAPWLACVRRRGKGTTHFCSQCGVRLAYTTRGQTAVLPSYVRPDGAEMSRGYTSHEKPTHQLPSATTIQSPLGACTPGQTSKPLLESIRLIPPPHQLEGKWQIQSSNPIAQTYDLTIGPLPPWTENTTGTQDYYATSVRQWQQKYTSAPREPEISLEQNSVTITARIFPISWNFQITTPTRSFNFTRPFATRDEVEWHSCRGPVFWNVPEWSRQELCDAYGRTVAVYGTKRERGRHYDLQITKGLQDEVVSEILITMVAIAVYDGVRRAWLDALEDDDDD